MIIIKNTKDTCCRRHSLDQQPRYSGNVRRTAIYTNCRFGGQGRRRIL